MARIPLTEKDGYFAKQDTSADTEMLQDEIIKFIITDLKREAPRYIAYIPALVKGVTELSAVI